VVGGDGELERKDTGKAYRESCDSFEAATISPSNLRCFGEDDVVLQRTCLARHSNSENHMHRCGL
jgi:hypothetical protein